MPLACLNAMLNSNCKGKDAMFYRAPGQAACFGLKVMIGIFMHLKLSTWRPPSSYSELSIAGSYRHLSPATST